jgi:peptidoglycan hydrolase-like protein with peptidoglycan-binding domain
MDSTPPRAAARRRPIARLLVAAAVVSATIPAGVAGASPSAAVVDRPIRLPHLSPGDGGDGVLLLQTRLAAAGFYHHDLDGTFGPETASAVVAFHKYLGRARTDEFDTIDWHLLNNLPDPGLPDRGDATDFVEVDLTRQLLFVIRDGAIEGIVPVSTGGGHTYWSARNRSYARASTPRGDFTLRWRQYGWVTDRTTGWSVYKYWAFSDFYGLHGYRSVPTTPASHGCVRLHVWDADWIEHRLFIGMTVHIWDTPPPPPEPVVIVRAALPVPIA